MSEQPNKPDTVTDSVAIPDQDFHPMCLDVSDEFKQKIKVNKILYDGLQSIAHFREEYGGLTTADEAIHYVEKMAKEILAKADAAKKVELSQTPEGMFNLLADEWERKTGHLSNFSAMCRMPEFAQLVAFGEQAVPWAIERMGETDHRWIMVLDEILGEGPYYENSGRMRLIIAEWKDWWHTKEYRKTVDPSVLHMFPLPPTRKIERRHEQNGQNSTTA